MTADIYRVPAAEVKKAGGGAFILDRGMMSRASAASDGNYHFSELTACRKPLAIVGKWSEVTVFIGSKPGVEVVNQIPDLPEIYGKVGFYKPASGIEGLFPVADSVAQVANSMVNMFAPTPAEPADGSWGSDRKEMLGAAKSAVKKKGVKKLDRTDVIVQIHYLRESGMHTWGKGSLKFDKLLLHVCNGLQKLNA